MSYMKRLLKKTQKRHKPADALSPHGKLYRQFDLILHIGSPKAGTSALQRFCMQNRSLLSKQGLFYPKHGIDKNGVSGGHSKLAIALMEQRLQDAQEMFDAWYEEAKQKDATLFLSSEAFFNIAALMTPLLAHKRVLVIAYHRNIPDYVVSVHNQIVKRHYGTLTLKQYVQSLMNGSDEAVNLVHKSFSRIYGEWEEAAGRAFLIVRSYENSGSIEEDFMRRIGMDDSACVHNEKKVNISYTPDALEAKRLLNHVLAGDRDLDHRIDLKLQAYSERQDSRTETGRRNDVYTSLLSFTEEDERRVRETYVENASAEQKPSTARGGGRLDPAEVSKVFDYILKEPKIRAYLLDATLKKLRSGLIEYGGYKVAEMLGIDDIESYGRQSAWFSQTQLDHMARGDYLGPDYLREIALLLIARKDLANADRIISRALELRPKGPVLQKIKQSVSELRSTEQSKT